MVDPDIDVLVLLASVWEVLDPGPPKLSVICVCSNHGLSLDILLKVSKFDRMSVIVVDDQGHDHFGGDVILVFVPQNTSPDEEGDVDKILRTCVVQTGRK